MFAAEVRYIVHFKIWGDSDEIKRITSNVPRVGDEVRLDEGKFYRVTKVVWVYDEPEINRVNIQLEKIND